jgi:UDP-N-acetylmuramyl pentapeptide synthase
VTQVASLADITEFVKSLHPGDTVLIKGSRALGLENALEGLGA